MKLSHKTIKLSALRYLYLLVIPIFIVQISPRAFGLSATQQNLFNSGVYYFDATASSCGGAFVALGTITVVNAGDGVWNSGLKAPYILEQFAIETLKDVAKKTGTAETDVVTQEHVLALIAFMYGEGGDINNDNLFNPLNTSINLSGLISGANSGVGNQSFVSFDAGVEATASTIVGSFQSRLPAVLVKSQSTAEEFMYALAYYDKYDGNHYWASASAPPNQDNYYKQRIELVEQVRNDYKDYAGIVIGTATHEANSVLNLALVKYAPSPTPGQSSGCPKNNIVGTALALAWPTLDKNRGINKSDATIAYQTAMPLYNGSTGSNEWTDCGVFVSTVLRDSGADPNYPLRGTSIQQNYIENHPDLYQILNATNTSTLQPGDIFVNSQHTFIYVGSQTNGYNAMAGNLNEWVPQANGAFFASKNGEPFLIARLH